MGRSRVSENILRWDTDKSSITQAVRANESVADSLNDVTDATRRSARAAGDYETQLKQVKTSADVYGDVSSRL
jgi:hypothetical protein